MLSEITSHIIVPSLPDHPLQSFTFEASDHSRSLSLTQINNLESDISLVSIAKIAHCLQVFALTRQVYPLYNAVFGVQYSEFPNHPSPGVAIAARCTEIARTPPKPLYAGRVVYKSYQMSELASMCIMFKCHMLLYIELNKIHVYMYSYGTDEGTTIVR